MTFPFPMFCPSAVALPSIAYQTSAEDINALTTYTFSSQAFGTASATRSIIVGVSSAIAGSATISSATIGGVSATISKQFAQGTRAVAGIIIASVPTGTTGTVAITFNTAMLRCAIGVWAAYDLSSITATATAQSSANPEDLSLNVSANGIAVGVSYNNVISAGSASWTGFTERFDFGVQGLYTGADYTATTAQTPLAVTLTHASPSNDGGVSASFR